MDINDSVELRELGGRLRRRWWIPALLAVAGVVLGTLIGDRAAPVYRSQGTLLVGPLSGTVTRSTTLRASESLASFYADLARRQVVLGPVVDALDLPASWQELRNQVSAVIPDRNPRLVTVTVSDADKAQAQRIAHGIVQQLIELSPAPSPGTGLAFVSEQVKSLQEQIEAAETQVEQLDKAIAAEKNPSTRELLIAQEAQRQKLLDEWRHTYVELMAVDPTSDAGGLRVIDDVRPLTSLDRAGHVTQGVLGGVVGLVLGLLVVWLLSGIGGRRTPASSVEERSGKTETIDLGVHTAARQRKPLPVVARSPAHET